MIPTWSLVENVVPPLLCLRADAAEVCKSEKYLGPLNTGKEEALITPVTQMGALK